MKQTNKAASELLKERKQTLDATIRGNNPKRMLLFSQTRAWPILDAGLKLTEAFTDYDRWFDVMCRCQERYQFDFYSDLGTRFSYKVTEALGGGGLIVDDEAGSVLYLDDVFMQPDEYDDLISMGLTKFFYERVFPKKYGLGKKTPAEAREMMKKAMHEMYELGQFNTRLYEQFETVYGVGRNTNNAPFFLKPPIDTISSCLRGIRGTSIDLRRVPGEKILEALHVIGDAAFDRLERELPKLKAADNIAVPVAWTATTSSFISAKQFEKYDWPFMKRMIDAVVANDATGLILPEGSIAHLLDFYQQIPAGHFAVICDSDDIRMLKEKLPNVTLIGGFPSYYLGHMSKQECVDRAKQLIDEVGYDRKLIFSTDKMLSHKEDALGENLEAVNEFVLDYGVYR